jgi:hypothetical protein
MAIVATVLGVITLLFVVLTSVKHYASQKLITLEVMTAGGIWLLGLALYDVPAAAVMGSSLLATQIVFGGTCVVFLLAVCCILLRPVPKSEIRRWLGELAALLRGEMRIDVALFRMAANCRSYRLAEDSKRIAELITGGDTLSQAMRVDEAFAGIVPAIRRAEDGGNLPQVLDQLASSGEPEADVNPAKAIAAEPPPVRRAVVTIIAEAMKQGASEVTLLPVQRGEYTGLSVLYTDSAGKTKEKAFLPYTVRVPIINVIKIWAGIPYWEKNPKPGTIAVRSDGKDYWVTISSEQTELGEALHVAIVPKTS